MNCCCEHAYAIDGLRIARIEPECKAHKHRSRIVTERLAANARWGLTLTAIGAMGRKKDCSKPGAGTRDKYIGNPEEGHL